MICVPCHKFVLGGFLCCPVRQTVNKKHAVSVKLFSPGCRSMDFMRLTMVSFQSYLGIVVHQSCSTFLMVRLNRWHNNFKCFLVENLSQRILVTLRVLCYLANLYANKLLNKFTQWTQKAVGLGRHVTEYISGWKQRNAVKLASFASVFIFSSWPIWCFIFLALKQFISEPTRENMKTLLWRGYVTQHLLKYDLR